MRKVAVVLFAFAFLLVFQAGSALASSKLDDAIAPLIGTKYRYGGTTTSGFDCSGFTGYVFRKLGLELPRSSGEQFKIGKKVSKDELRPGDLVFFNTSGKGVSHVGIYVGEGRFAHSSTSKGVVLTSMSDSYYVKRYIGARRVMDTDTYEALATDPEVANEEYIAETEGSEEELFAEEEVPADTEEQASEA